MQREILGAKTKIVVVVVVVVLLLFVYHLLFLSLQCLVFQNICFGKYGKSCYISYISHHHTFN